MISSPSGFLDAVRNAPTFEHLLTLLSEEQKCSKSLLQTFWQSELERRRLEEALSVASERATRAEARWNLELARAEAFSPVITASLKPDGSWLKVPSRLAQLFGYTDQLPPWPELLHPQERSVAARLRGLETGLELESRYCKKDGSIIWLTARFSPVEEPERSVLVYLRDVTEQRRTEMALREAHKLESMGMLAGGIAHDFNNLLTAILGNVTLAQLEDISPTVSNALSNVERAAQRAADLTRQMLAFSGRGRFVVGPVDLNRLLQEIMLLLTVTVSKKSRLHQDYGQNLPTIEADESQLQQLLVNLVTNASESLQDRAGIISIRTRCLQLDAADAASSRHNCPIEPGRYVALSVSDTGCGMAPEVMERIFEPFFSTKGWGRGLGLSAMIGILRGHRAGLTIHSVPGEGSEFTVYFPTFAPVVRSADQRTVLVADDEETVRAVARRMLENMGYAVIECADGLAVMEKLQARIPVDLLLMDLTMPNLDGRETLLTLRGAGYTLPVVLSSGYDEHDVQHELGLLVQGFLQKPFRMEELQQAVEAALV